MTEDTSHEPLTYEHLEKVNKWLEHNKKYSISEWEYPAQKYMMNLQGNFYDIWMMLQNQSAPKVRHPRCASAAFLELSNTEFNHKMICSMGI